MLLCLFANGKCFSSLCMVPDIQFNIIFKWVFVFSFILHLIPDTIIKFISWIKKQAKTSPWFVQLMTEPSTPSLPPFLSPTITSFNPAPPPPPPVTGKYSKATTSRGREIITTEGKITGRWVHIVFVFCDAGRDTLIACC